MRTSKTSRSPKTIDAGLLRRWPLPALPEHADKAARGDVLVLGGSIEIPGAVLLSGEAALRAGAGRVRLATARGAALALAVAFPEARVIGLPQRPSGELAPGGVRALHGDCDACSAVLVGPGMREHSAAERLVRALERREASCAGALILDAAGLRALDGRRAVRGAGLAGVVATPHAGEMAQLWGCPIEEVRAHPLRIATEAARTLNALIVLKGVETFIVEPDGRAFRNVAGNSGLATAGSGDVLAGLIAGFAARGAEPVQAAVWGVFLHAKAGEALRRKHGHMGYLAREIAREVPRLLHTLAR